MYMMLARLKVTWIQFFPTLSLPPPACYSYPDEGGRFDRHCVPVINDTRSSFRLIQNRITAKGVAQLADALQKNTGIMEIW